MDVSMDAAENQENLFDNIDKLTSYDYELLKENLRNFSEKVKASCMEKCQDVNNLGKNKDEPQNFPKIVSTATNLAVYNELS